MDLAACALAQAPHGVRVWVAGAGLHLLVAGGGCHQDHDGQADGQSLPPRDLFPAHAGGPSQSKCFVSVGQLLMSCSKVSNLQSSCFLQQRRRCSICEHISFCCDETSLLGTCEMVSPKSGKTAVHCLAELLPSKYINHLRKFVQECEALRDLEEQHIKLDLLCYRSTS